MRFLKCFFSLLLLMVSIVATAQPKVKLKNKDYRRDVALHTTEGTIVLRLSDSTPLHRDNFLRLVKSKYYDGILFHRVIKGFMIQAGDSDSKVAKEGQALGNGGPGYTIPAEMRSNMFHKKGVLAAARTGDDVNPERRSSGAQFYIVQGRTYTDAQMDSVEIRRLQGRKIPPAQRELYKTVGGTPQLDGNYTVYGEVVRGLDVVDKIANAPTTTQPRDRPVKNVRITKARLVRRR